MNLAIDKGSRVVILGYNGAGKTTTLRLLAHLEEPDTGSVDYGHGCKSAISRRNMTRLT